MIPWVEWLNSVTKNADVGDICTTIGASKTALRRWMTLQQPPAEVIISASVAYKTDVLVGLIVSGYITMEYIQSGVEERLKFVPTHFMTNELARRSAEETITSPVNPEWE